jgi:hypothetical protein
MIKFELNINDCTLNSDLSVLEYNKNELFDDMRKLIAYFNSEYNWDGMFSFDDIKNRIDKGHLLFILYYGTESIGYVFFEPKKNNEYYLYNLYVTNKVKRPNYTAQWFVNKSINLLPKSTSKVTCLCEDWHFRAHDIFKLNGFKLVM